jgi:gas vesicle protein
MTDKNCSGDFAAGFLVGALVGAAAALLLAPMSGEETRVMIREKGVELGQRADEMSLEARKRADELQAQAKERAEALQAQAKERAETLQERVKVAVDEGKATAIKTKEDLLAQVGQGEALEETPPAEA